MIEDVVVPYTSQVEIAVSRHLELREGLWTLVLRF